MAAYQAPVLTALITRIPLFKRIAASETARHGANKRGRE